MVSPNLIKKIDKPLTLNHNIKRIFQLIYGKQNKPESGGDDEVPRINVSNLVSKLSFVYEKIRNAVDYDDDHLLRKNAIKRILKRQIVIESLLKTATPEDISFHLLTELIQAGYLPNNKIPEAKIKEVAEMITKYVKLKNYSFKKNSYFSSLIGNDKHSTKEKNRLVDWIIAIAASDIENNLGKDAIKQAAVGSMYDILSASIKLPEDLPYQKDLDIQIYLSISKSFLKYDTDMLNLVLFKYYNNKWDNPQDEDIEEISQRIDSLYKATGRQLNHPLAKQLDKIVKTYSMYFNTLIETVETNPNKIYDQALNNSKNFFNSIKETCGKKYAKIKSRLWRSGVRSILYIFLTKSIFVFLLEVPAIKFFGEEMNYLALGINVIFPALLLFLIIMFTGTPNNANTNKIISGIGEIVFLENRRQNSITLKKPRRRRPFTSFLFNLVYAAAFSLSVYLLIKGLSSIDFNWVSITIFLFFLTFVSFFSFRIKREVKEAIVTEEKENILSFIFEFFYMPIVAAGKFLSDNISRVNVFVFVLDFIIEAPFKVVVEIVEDWTRYLKEKKEDLS